MNSKIYERIELLSEVLEYCTQLQEKGKGAAFSSGERILINQERGALFTQLDESIDNREFYTQPDNARFFTVPQYLENKIQFNHSKIIQ